MDDDVTTPGPRRDRRRQRRRQRRRRLVVLVALLFVVAGVVAIALSRGGGAHPPDPAATPGSVRRSTPPPKVWVASAARPVRVWVGGDSMGGELGWTLGPMLEKAKVFKPTLFYKESSGICRWDFYDWGDQMKRVVRTVKPDAMVLMMGTNDTQSVWQNGHWITWGDPTWKKVYQKRVSDMTKTALRGGVRRVYWVGMPIMGERWRNTRMKFIDGILQKTAAQIPGAGYVDSWSLFAGADGKFVPSLRLADGVHFTVEGQRILAKAVLAAVKRDWLPGGAPVPAPSGSAASL
jgi:hypothetical protein